MMEWSDKLSVKISVFDGEHKKLILLINKLADAMSQGQGHQALDDILIELVDYTKYHFSHEEESMQKYNYPDFASHKLMHEDFVSKVGETKDKYEKGIISLSVSTLNYLTSWVQNHIMKTDANYTDFFTKAGLK